MARTGVITRRDIITDQALEFGGVYAKNVEKAISANKKMVIGAKALHKVFLDINSVQGNSAFNAYLQNTAVLMQQISSAVALQNAALRENQNITNQLTASQVTANQARLEQLRIDRETQRLGTAESQRRRSDIALQEAERRQTEAQTRAQQRQARETANQASAYVQLQRRRNEAQRTLADLLSAERLNITEIQRAQREFQILDRRLQAVDAAVRNYSRNVGNYQSAFRGLNSTMRELISTFGLATGIALFGMIVKDIFSTIKDFDRQLIAVGKTTNISGEELKQFGREVVELGDKLDGVSIEGLLKSAEVAGQLGVRGTENILKFSTAVEKLKLTSNIISDEQVQNFAKFIEVSSDSFENADRLASVITQLGNNFASTEAEVLANATEIQKGTAVYKTSAEGVLALGAATSALGSEAESSRSAIQSTFAVLNNAIALGTNLTKVLKITGLTQAELKKEFGEDATKVFQKFVKGLNTAKNEGQNLSLVLNELGIKEKRAFTVVGSLAANYNLLERAMNMASEEYKNNIALNQEVEAASQSVASILGDIKDKWDKYILSTNDANKGTQKITTALKFLRDNLSTIITAVLKFGSVVITFIGVQKAWNTIMVIGTAIKTAANVAALRFALSTGIGTRAVLAQAAAVRAATTAQAGLNTAMSATPWGLILALVGAAVIAYQVFNDELSKHELLLQRIKDQNESMQEAEDAYASDRDKNRESDFKQIEDDIRLRKEKGENSRKLDQEEIARKKEVVSAQLNVYSMLKDGENARTENEIKKSEARIAQLDKEIKETNKINQARGGFSTAGNITSEKLSEARKTAEGELDILKQKLFKNTQLTEAEEKKLNKILNDLGYDKAVKDAQFAKEESEKQRRAREKAQKEYLDSLKKAENDEFALREFRLKNAIDINDQIADDEKRDLSERLDAEYEKNQEEISLSNETLEHKLILMALEKDGVEKLSKEKQDSYLKNSKAEITQLIKTGEIKRDLTNQEKLVLEQHAANLLAIDKKLEIDRQKLIDSEVDRIHKKLDQETGLYERFADIELKNENERFKKLLEAGFKSDKLRELAVEEHERNIQKIKDKFAKQEIQNQIDDLENFLKTDNAKFYFERISNDKREEMLNEIASLRRKLGEVELTEEEVKDEKLKELKEKAKEITIEIATQLKDALIDLGNTLFDARISNIESEIEKNNEKYAYLIEQAKGDADQQELLRQEGERKRQELEKKKRKEEMKAAVFNKAMATINIGINLAQAISAINLAAAAMDAITPYAFGAVGLAYRAFNIPLAIGVAAAQLASVVASPLPKYKHGRKGGRAEFAEVGDGYVSEVVQKADGKAYITPNRPTLTYLEKGDSVYSSIEDYNKMMIASSQTSLMIHNGKIHDYQNSKEFEDKYGSETLEVMKQTLRAIKNQKQNIHVHPAKIDFGYEIWKSKNTSWK